MSNLSKESETEEASRSSEPSRRRRQTEEKEASAARKRQRVQGSLLKGVQLKPDAEWRPLYTLGKHHLFLERWSPFYKQAYDFVIAVAEPVARPDLFHEYRLTRYSLYAAMAIGLEPSTIVAVLDRLSKTTPPKEMKKFIEDEAERFGAARLVLQQGKYFIESREASVLSKLLESSDIEASRVLSLEDNDTSSSSSPPSSSSSSSSSSSFSSASSSSSSSSFRVTRTAMEDSRNLQYS